MKRPGEPSRAFVAASLERVSRRWARALGRRGPPGPRYNNTCAALASSLHVRDAGRQCQGKSLPTVIQTTHGGHSGAPTAASPEAHESSCGRPEVLDAGGPRRDRAWVAGKAPLEHRGSPTQTRGRSGFVGSLRGEVNSVLERMGGVPALVCVPLYGTEMRLSECLSLRVKDIDFDSAAITLRSGKGAKDRVTLLPERYPQGLLAQLEHTRRQHEGALRGGLGEAPLPLPWPRSTPTLPAGGGGSTCSRPRASTPTPRPGAGTATTCMGR